MAILNENDVRDRVGEIYYPHMDHPHNLAGSYAIEVIPAVLVVGDVRQEYWHSTVVFSSLNKHKYPTPYSVRPDFILHARDWENADADGKSRERARKAANEAAYRYETYWWKTRIRYEILHMHELEMFEATAEFGDTFNFPALPPKHFKRSDGCKAMLKFHQDSESQANLKAAIAMLDAEDDAEAQEAIARYFPMPVD
jgi:hypothetical protein